VVAYTIAGAHEKANLSQDRDAKPKGLLLEGSRVAEKEKVVVYSDPLSKLKMLLLAKLRRIATLSTLMAVLAIVLFMSIVLGYI
jgi:hypothetical protein